MQEEDRAIFNEIIFTGSINGIFPPRKTNNSNKTPISTLTVHRKPRSENQNRSFTQLAKDFAVAHKLLPSGSTKNTDGNTTTRSAPDETVRETRLDNNNISTEQASTTVTSKRTSNTDPKGKRLRPTSQPPLTQRGHDYENQRFGEEVHQEPTHRRQHNILPRTTSPTPIVDLEQLDESQPSTSTGVGIRRQSHFEQHQGYSGPLQATRSVYDTLSSSDGDYREATKDQRQKEQQTKQTKERTSPNPRRNSGPPERTPANFIPPAPALPQGIHNVPGNSPVNAQIIETTYPNPRGQPGTTSVRGADTHQAQRPKRILPLRTAPPSKRSRSSETSVRFTEPTREGRSPSKQPSSKRARSFSPDQGRTKAKHLGTLFKSFTLTRKPIRTKPTAFTVTNSTERESRTQRNRPVPVTVNPNNGANPGGEQINPENATTPIPAQQTVITSSQQNTSRTNNNQIISRNSQNPQYNMALCD